jgi:transglutaminase-like putative cysteine protease
MLLATAIFLLSSPCLAAPDTLPPLAHPPLGERWFSIVMNKEKTGFSHLQIREAGDGYEVTAESCSKMVVLGFSRENSSWERYLINRDLSLRSFEVTEIVDGKPLHLKGEATTKGVRVSIAETGRTKEKTLKAKGAVYPPPVLNLYPLMQGVAPGKKFRLNMLDIEEAKIQEVKITVVGVEHLAGGPATVRLQNNLYPVVDNDIWVDYAGNTVQESVREGLIVTRAEDGRSARKFLYEAALAQKALVRDFSLVRVDSPLGNPAVLMKLVVELAGIPGSLPLPEGGGQKGSRVNGERVVVAVERPLLRLADNHSPMPLAPASRYLGPSDEIIPQNAEIIALKNEIVGTEQAPERIVQKLAHWVAAQIADRPADGRTPLETIAAKSGNSESHARLYASLARAAGIPTRLVAGLFYVSGKGFLYHGWAESYVGAGDWLAVDPTLGQVPADVTHIKLVEGDTPEELLPLADVVGRVRARILEKK